MLEAKNTMSSRTPYRPAAVQCRQIGSADLESITDLLTAGFPNPRAHWVRALKILAHREVPEGFPRYGYLLKTEMGAVGVILLIFSQVRNTGALRCNGSAWYVAPAFRTFAPLLLKAALKHPATHTDLSPAIHTLPMIESLGYRRFCNGAFAAVPVLAAGFGKMKIHRVVDATHSERLVPDDYLTILVDHESFGCLSLW